MREREMVGVPCHVRRLGHYGCRRDSVPRKVCDGRGSIRSYIYTLQIRLSVDQEE